MNILIMNEYFFPGYKAGGPIRTIINLVEYLGVEYHFSLITRDRDLGDKKKYQGIRYNSWNNLGRVSVYYCSPKELNIFSWCLLLRKLEYDILYLNGYFSQMTIRTLFLQKLCLLPRKPTILAPRGEFSQGAISLKAYKKRPYIFVSRLLGLYRGLTWHASSLYEAEDINREFTDYEEKIIVASLPIKVAPDPFIIKDIESESNVHQILDKEPGLIKIIYLARIARNKNLKYALGLLLNLSGQVQFDIYGPCEDSNYWSECRAAIEQMPSSVHVSYHGAVPNEKVRNTFGQYHLFLFPTKGENFGHVILEALSAGCLVAISDRTPWRNLTELGVGWDISLEKENHFRAVIQKNIFMDNEEFVRRSNAARKYVADYIIWQDKELSEAYKNLFESPALVCPDV